MSDIEAEIKAKGLTAPRITPADLEAQIICEAYPLIVVPDSNGNDMILHDARFPPSASSIPAVYSALKCLTLCVLVCRNGFTVVGKSACASPENFDAALGRKIARQDAVDQLWPLLGFELRSRLANEAAQTA